jgi:hypothetical protein
MAKINRLMIRNIISKNNFLGKKEASRMSKNSKSRDRNKMNKSKGNMKNAKRKMKMKKKSESNKTMTKIKKLLNRLNSKTITTRISMEIANKNPEDFISICLIYIYFITFLKLILKFSIRIEKDRNEQIKQRQMALKKCS